MTQTTTQMTFPSQPPIRKSFENMVGPWGLEPKTSTVSLTYISFLHTLSRARLGAFDVHGTETHRNDEDPEIRHDVADAEHRCDLVARCIPVSC